MYQRIFCDLGSTWTVTGSRFCNQCATSLGKLCPKCAFDNPPEAKFCAHCAAPLDDTASILPKAEAGPTKISIETCIIKLLPQGQWIPSADRAIEINPANAPFIQMLRQVLPHAVMPPE